MSLKLLQISMTVKAFSTYGETKGLDVTSLPGLAVSVFMDLCNSGETARNNNELSSLFILNSNNYLRCSVQVKGIKSNSFIASPVSKF